MENSIKIWKPLPNIPNKLFLKELVHKDGLTIVLGNESNQNEIVTIHLEHCYGYRNFDESYHLRTLDEIPFILQDWCLYITKEGDFIESFNRLSYDIYKDWAVNYMIVTSDGIIEIIAASGAEVIVTKEIVS